MSSNDNNARTLKMIKSVQALRYAFIILLVGEGY